MKTNLTQRSIKIAHKRKWNIKTNAIHSREDRKRGTVEPWTNRLNIKQAWDLNSKCQ